MTERRKTCLQCDAPIEQTEGRRERKFCKDTDCAQKYWLATHPKEKRFKRIPIAEYEKLFDKKPLQSKEVKLVNSNTLIYGATPPDNKDQNKEVPDKVLEYENELKSIEGKTSSIANQRRKWLNGQILKLKS